MERSLNSVVEIVVALSPNMEFLALEFEKESKDFHKDPILASPTPQGPDILSCFGNLSGQRRCGDPGKGLEARHSGPPPD